MVLCNIILKLTINIDLFDKSDQIVNEGCKFYDRVSNVGSLVHLGKRLVKDGKDILQQITCVALKDEESKKKDGVLAAVLMPRSTTLVLWMYLED